MNFSRVKLFICVCLLVVNVIFAFMNIKIVSDMNYISEEEVQFARKHLAGNGMDFDFDKQARKLYNLPIYAVKTADDDNIPKIYKQMTEAFFSVETEDSAYVKTPEGYSISVKNDNGILLGTSSLDGGTRFECYKEGALESKDINEISKLPHTVQREQGNGERTKIASDYISTALKGCGIKYTYCGEREYNNGTIVSFRTEFSDVAAVNLFLNVYVSKNKILCCIGNIADAVPEKKYDCDVIDSIDILYMLKNHIDNGDNSRRTQNIKIIRVEMTYKMYENDFEVKYLIPSWFIEYAKGNEKSQIVIMDAVTGENIEAVQ